MTQPREALVVEDLHKSFGLLEVLKGISMTAHEHDVVSILGSSGSGKSTLLRCINLLETPDAGNVSVQGELIRMRRAARRAPVPEDRRQVERIRAKLGMVFQQFNLWSHMTVLENVVEAPRHVLLVSKAEATERAELRVRIAMAVREARDIVTGVIEASGAHAHFLDNPLQRIQRDLNTAGGHTVFDLDAGTELYGRLLLGYPPNLPI